MVKSFSEYIKEHFGAITVEYPPEHMVVKNPNLPQPLSINTWVGGTGRIPKHWNNSPYLSGGFGGSGYGRFGQDPNPGKPLLSNELNMYLETLSKIEDVLSTFQNDEYVKIALDLKKDIEDGNIILDDMGPKALKMDELGMQIEIEIIEYPTPGHSGSHDEPPDYGDPGSYEAAIIGSSSGSEQDDQELARLLGVKSIKDIPSLDEIANGFLNDSFYIQTICDSLGILDAAKWLTETAQYLENDLQALYEQNDESYFENEGSITTEYELYDVVSETPYDSLEYLIRFSAVDNQSKRFDMNSKIRELSKKLIRPDFEGNLINLIKKDIIIPASIERQQVKYFK